MKLSPTWSWVFVAWALFVVALLVRFAVLAFLPLRPDEIEANYPIEPWVNPGMEPAKFEADVLAEEQSDGPFHPWCSDVGMLDDGRGPIPTEDVP
jgi:hypothetical protein